MSSSTSIHFSHPERMVSCPNPTDAPLPFYPISGDTRERYDEFTLIPEATLYDRHWYTPLASRNLTPETVARICCVLRSDRNLLPLHYRHRRENPEVQDAITSTKALREEFYHELLRLDDPANPNTDSFARFKKKDRQTSLPPIGQFITAQRHLVSNGLSAPQLFARAPELYKNTMQKNAAGIRDMLACGIDREDMSRVGYLFLVLSGDNTAATVRTMVDNGLDYVKILRKNHSAIGLTPKRIGSRVTLAERLCETLRLPLSGTDVLNEAPLFLNMSEKKLWAIARLLADHGDPETLPPKATRAHKLSTLPLACLAQCILETGKLTTNTTEQLQNSTHRTERTPQLLASLSDEEKSQRLSPASRLAILRYINE